MGTDLDRPRFPVRRTRCDGPELSLATGCLDPGTPAQADPKPIEILDEAERVHIVKALKACGWRLSGERGAAELLGLKPPTLDFCMKKFGINRPA
jgi:formate hydrogenlyase transcriptional activator